MKTYNTIYKNNIINSKKIFSNVFLENEEPSKETDNKEKIESDNKLRSLTSVMFKMSDIMSGYLSKLGYFKQGFLKSKGGPLVGWAMTYILIFIHLQGNEELSNKILNELQSTTKKVRSIYNEADFDNKSLNTLKTRISSKLGEFANKLFKR